MQDVVKMLEKQDDLIEIQLLLLLLSGFLTFLLLVFMVYRLKWLSLMQATAKTIKQDPTETEKTANTKAAKEKIATFVLAKPVMTIENDLPKDQAKLHKGPKSTRDSRGLQYPQGNPKRKYWRHIPQPSGVRSTVMGD